MLQLTLLVVSAALGAASARAADPASAYYAPDTDGIFWFMHLSDLHVGTNDSLEQNWDPQNTQFVLNEGVQVIQPSFVVVTGDLVDGSEGFLSLPTSGQGQAEWNAYKGLYTGAGMTSTFYYDIIGNHDLYGNPDPNWSWYLSNSLQGQATGATHFSWTHTTTLGDYYFYGFNNIGQHVAPYSDGTGTILGSELAALQAGLQANASADLIFVFAHQEVDRAPNSGPVVTAASDANALWIHGDVHEYREYLAGGTVLSNEVDSVGKANANNIAVGVVDHNAFVYRATGTSGPWPFVVITAPVSADLRNGAVTNPYAYSVCKDRVNPVRALAFAQATVNEVNVQIGGLPQTAMAAVAGKPKLWAGGVDTSALTAGFHDVTVTARTGGTSATHTIPVDFTAGPCSPVQQDGGVQQDAAPPQDDAAPVQDDAAPAQDDAGAAQDDAGAAQDDAGAAQDDAAPAPTDATPTPTDATPTPTDATPTPTDAALPPTDAAPAQGDAAPLPGDAAPVPDDGGGPPPDGAPTQLDGSTAPDGAAGDAGGVAGPRGGCSCRAASTPTGAPGGLVLVIAALGIALRVRRRHH